MSANTYLAPAITIPGTLLITAITRAYPMVVSFTNSDENTYVPGQLMRLFIPSSYQMIQANNLQGKILSIDNVSYTMALDIDSTHFDAFVVPPPYTAQPASMAPAGSRNLTLGNDTSRVPFQNLSNSGN